MRELSAITVGSFKTIPFPRANTSVFAVPRSIARSLATTHRPVSVQRYPVLTMTRHSAPWYGASVPVHSAGADVRAERPPSILPPMDLGGFVPGEEPDDLGHEAEHEFEGHRGWIPPDDRLWRHPSEMSSGMPLSATGPRARGMANRDRVQQRRRATGIGAVGAAVMIAALAGGFILADVPAGHEGGTRTLVATETSLVGSSGSGAASSTASTILSGAGVENMVMRIRPSLVQLVTSSGTRTLGTGVVVGDGTLVLTAASAVAGVNRPVVITSRGRRVRTRLLGVDPHSGVAVLGVKSSRSLVPASFADETVQPGELAIATCLCDASGSGLDPYPLVALSTVKDEGSPVDPGRGVSLVDAIEADAPLSPSPKGGVLLDQRGRVIGILEALEQRSSDRVGVFVPTQLALGVAAELAHDGQVSHGWLGVNATDMVGGCGAEIVKVMSSMPAARAGFASGDVIDEVDGHPVCTLADLQARLYVTPPGEQVQIHVETPVGGRTVSVALAAAA